MRAVGSGSGGDNPPADKPGAWKEGAIMARTAALPALKAESGLSHYLDEIRRFPMLEPQEEYVLARSWREHGDREAAHKLVTSHLRLVAKIDRKSTRLNSSHLGISYAVFCLK